MGCAPNFTGVARFRVVVSGETGEVTEAAASGVTNADEAACMESVVQSARFPRFTRPTLTMTYPFSLDPNE